MPNAKSVCPFNDRLDSTMSGLSQIQLKTLKFYDYEEVVLDGKSRDFTLLDVFSSIVVLFTENDRLVAC